MNCFLGPALRTPLGAFGGALRGYRVPELAAVVARALTDRVGAPDRLILASGLPGGQGADPARETIQLAGLPATPAFLVQRGLASGLWGLQLGLEALQAGAHRVQVVAADAPSAAPYLLPTARWGVRIGETELRDPLLDFPGRAPEPSPWEQLSRARARRAQEQGAFRDQCCPLPRRRRPFGLMEEDEAPNQPGPLPWADGAAGVVLQTAPSPLRILGWAQAGDPQAALMRALEAQGQSATALQCVEVDLPLPQDPSGVFPELDPSRLAPAGDGWALGRPLGASGLRALVDLAHGLLRREEGLGALVQVTEDLSWAILIRREKA